MHFSSTNFLSCTQLTLLDQILPIPLCCHINYLENEGKKKIPNHSYSYRGTGQEATRPSWVGAVDLFLHSPEKSEMPCPSCEGVCPPFS